jgi:hypothetical protein
MHKRAIAGALAGLLAGVVFGIMMQMMKAPNPGGEQVPMMAMVAMVVRSQSQATGWIYHLFNSALIGGLFGGLLGGRAEAGYGSGLRWGALWGLIWWVLGGLILMPLLLGMPAFAALRMPPMRPVAFGSLVGHLIYGGILGLAYVRLRHSPLRPAAVTGTARVLAFAGLWIAAGLLPRSLAAQQPLVSATATPATPRPAPDWRNTSWVKSAIAVRLEQLQRLSYCRSDETVCRSTTRPVDVPD